MELAPNVCEPCSIRQLLPSLCRMTDAIRRR
jgi:hypothetical protein